jgi:putative transcriptional regulator
MLSRKRTPDAETLAFQAQLLASVKQMAAGKAASRKRVKVPAVVGARLASGLSQARFAQLLGISVRTLQKWEQGEREPSGAAKTLIAIATRHPEVLLQVAA